MSRSQKISEKPPFELDANVMIDARYLNGEPSGIGAYTESVIRELLEIAPNLDLTLVASPNRPVPVESPRVESRIFPAPPNSLRTHFLFSAYFDFEEIDLFHSPFNILPRGLPVPSVFTLHDIMWLMEPAYCTRSLWRRLVTGSFYRNVIPASVDAADSILTVSHSSRRDIVDYFPDLSPDRVRVAHNAVDASYGPMEPAEAWPVLERYLPPRSRFILVVGQGSPYKNHAGALEGFLRAFGNDPHIYLVLVRRLTRGPTGRFETLLENPNLNSRLVHLEEVSSRELRALYSRAEVFLFPSLYEGFGLPILEAMSCGTPVLTSDRGAPSEVAGDAALTVDPNSPGAIGRGLRRLTGDRELRSQLVDRGFDRIRDFSWRNTAIRVLRSYREALERAKY